MTLGNYLSSFKYNIDKKVRNPFFFTFTIVLVLKNWQLFYSLFYFDSTDTRINRIEIIDKYITNAGNTWEIFGWTLIWTFGAMLSAYLFQSIGVLVSNYYDAVINPKLMEFASKGAKVVTKIDFDILDAKYNRLDSKLKEERTKRYDTENELEKVEKEYADCITSRDEQMEKLREEIALLTSDFNNLKVENNNLRSQMLNRVLNERKEVVGNEYKYTRQFKKLSEF